MALSNIKSSFRYDINALRAFAVISVVLYHFNIKGFSVGFIGVDIFFVISGYLMTQISLGMLEKNNFSYFKFIFARVKRIWPALIFLVLILSAIGMFLLPSTDYVLFAKQAKEALFFTSNIEFAKGGGYFTSNIEERWFLHSWSLSVEWQFYCLYPLMLYVIWMSIKGLEEKYRRYTLHIILVALSVISYAYSIYLTKQNQSQAFFSLGTRAWEMMMGAQVLLLTHTNVGAWFRAHASLLKIVSAALLTSCVWLGHGGGWTSIWPGSYALIPVAATAIYILASDSNNFWQLLENNKITQSLGNWSYSIYLWHWPVVIAINFLGFSTIPFKLKLSGIILSLGLGFLSFRFIESAFREKKSEWLPQIAKIAAIYSLSLVSVLLITTSDYFKQNALKADIALSKLPSAYENYKVKPEGILNVYRINEHGKKSILVLGDSHAEHLYPWFKKNITQDAVSFVVTNGCPPFPQMNRYDTTGWYCHESFEKIRNLINQNQYDLIVVSGNWYPLDEDIPGICSFRFQNCKGIDPAENRKIAVQALSIFFNEINARGIPIVVVKPTPFADYAIGKIFPRYQLWGVEIPQNFTDKNAAKKNGDRFIEDVIRITELPNLIYTADLKSSFCHDGICEYFDENEVPVYWDDNHFNPEWIVEHGHALDVVKNILNNKKS